MTDSEMLYLEWAGENFPAMTQEIQQAAEGLAKHMYLQGLRAGREVLEEAPQNGIGLIGYESGRALIRQLEFAEQETKWHEWRNDDGL